MVEVEVLQAVALPQAAPWVPTQAGLALAQATGAGPPLLFAREQEAELLLLA